VLAVLAMALALSISLGWRNPWAPAAGALLGLALAMIGGVATLDDCATRSATCGGR